MTGERFTRVPGRLQAALIDGSLPFTQFGLLVFFAGRVNYETGRLSARLSSLKEETGYPYTVEKLRQDLHALRGAGELDFEMVAGQRSPVEFRLIGDGFGVKALPVEQLDLDHVGHVRLTALPALPPPTLSPTSLEVASPPPTVSPSSLEVTSNGLDSSTGTNADDDRVSTSNEPPTPSRLQQQTKPRSEGSHTSRTAAASESEPVSIERAVAKLATLNGWDTGSLNVVMPLLQAVPAVVFEETLQRTLSRRGVDNRVGLLVHLLGLSISDWRKAQNDARLATWDAFFGEAGLDRVKQADPVRYVRAWATPGLESARPLPPNLVTEHVVSFAFERFADDADARATLFAEFVRAADRIPAFHSLRDWALKALDRDGLELDAVLDALTTLTEGSPEAREELHTWAREIAANVDRDRRIA